jgi:hypothetical protein
MQFIQDSRYILTKFQILIPFVSYKDNTYSV